MLPSLHDDNSCLNATVVGSPVTMPILSTVQPGQVVVVTYRARLTSTRGFRDVRPDEFEPHCADAVARQDDCVPGCRRPGPWNHDVIFARLQDQDEPS